MCLVYVGSEMSPHPVLHIYRKAAGSAVWSTPQLRETDRAMDAPTALQSTFLNSGGFLRSVDTWLRIDEEQPIVLSSGSSLASDSPQGANFQVGHKLLSVEIRVSAQVVKTRFAAERTSMRTSLHEFWRCPRESSGAAKLRLGLSQMRIAADWGA